MKICIIIFLTVFCIDSLVFILYIFDSSLSLQDISKDLKKIRKRLDKQIIYNYKNKK